MTVQPKMDFTPQNGSKNCRLAEAFLCTAYYIYIRYFTLGELASKERMPEQQQSSIGCMQTLVNAM